MPTSHNAQQKSWNVLPIRMKWNLPQNVTHMLYTSHVSSTFTHTHMVCDQYIDKFTNRMMTYIDTHMVCEDYIDMFTNRMMRCIDTHMVCQEYIDIFTNRTMTYINTYANGMWVVHWDVHISHDHINKRWSHLGDHESDIDFLYETESMIFFKPRIDFFQMILSICLSVSQ